jgi:hypothetical protein
LTIPLATRKRVQADLFGEGPAHDGAGEPALPETASRAAANRIRTLLLTDPLHALHRNKAHRPSLRGIDVRTLSLLALDMTIEGMGLGEGITRRELAARLRTLSPLFTGQEADAVFGEACDFVVDGLVNAPRSEAFREEYLAVEEGTPELRHFEFRLLQEEDHGGRVVLRATKYAINLCLRMLETEIEDAQVANEAVLEDQLRRGAISRAVVSAQQARMLSIGLRERIDDLLARIARDAGQVDYETELKPRLDEAREHLVRRASSSDRLLEVVEDKLDDARGDAARELARLRETLRDCRARHAHLAERVMRATREFLDNQERQSFRRARSGRLPAMEAEVARPALLLPAGAVEAMAPGIVALLHAPARVPVFSLAVLAEACLAPRRETATMQAVVDDSPPEEVVPPPPRFSDRDRDEVLAWLHEHVARARPEGLALSTLVARAEEERWSAGRVCLLGLEALRLMERHREGEPGDEGVVAAPSGATFSGACVAGDDLLLALREAAS